MFRKQPALQSIILLASFSLSACSDGLLGGGITANFAGISSALVMSPEDVSISWKPDSKCNSYEIFSLSASTTDSLLSAAIPPVSVRYPQVGSERSYSFAVLCKRDDGLSTGLDVSLQVTTWPKFSGQQGPLSITAPGQFRLSWNYLLDTGTRFDVYALESQVPGVEKRLTRINPLGDRGFKDGYVETPICSTYKQNIVIGPGAECDPGNLLMAGSMYQFRVVAIYPNGTYSEDLAGNYTTKLIDPAFTPPNCQLTRIGMGPDQDNTYLYLRCSPGGESCPFNSLSVKAYQGQGNARVGVSDTLSLQQGSSNLLQILAKPGLDGFKDRLVKNLEIEFICTKGNGSTQKAVIRYDNSLPSATEPSMKFGNSQTHNNYELAPEQSFKTDVVNNPTKLQAPSLMGSVTATGDFDCNGKPDLAVGLPRVTFNSAPYFNQTNDSGAVKIYYDYISTEAGQISAANVQYLSFSDLPEGARFGGSLSAGNINRDVYSRSGKYFSCDDLIIGADGSGNAGYVGGRAFIFYGQPERFPQPLNYKDLAVNSPTCGGNFDAATCAPVQLNANSFTDLFKVNPRVSGINIGGNWSSYPYFGRAVLYARDFNADGYGDVVIGDPTCWYDGTIQDVPFTSVAGVETTGYYPNSTNGIPEAGCAYLYFGGPFGLQSKQVANRASNSHATSPKITAPYIKIYSPIPMPYAHFGASLAAGGDVNGALPVPVQMPGGTIILQEGNDIAIGAPDFNYNYTLFDNLGSHASAPGFDSTFASEDPIVRLPNNSNEISKKFTPPLNNAWGPTSDPFWNNVPNPTDAAANSNKGLRNSTGLVVLYLGRASFKPYTLTLKNPTNLFPYSNLILGTELFYSSVLDQLSLSYKDRQTGSKLITYATTNPSTINSPEINPVESFYNCGSRGQETAALTNALGVVNHFSCLAGRNNFSLIFPHLAPNDTSVRGFGTKIAILGAKERNHVGLWNLESYLGKAAFVEAAASDASTKVIAYHAQGNIHESIRGTSLWEAGVPAFNLAGSATTTLSGSNLSSESNRQTATATTTNLARSPLRDTLSMTAAGTTISIPAGGSKQTQDVNRDGFADVSVGTALNGTTAAVYTYFGNLAADFAYSYHVSSPTLPYDTGASCSRSTLIPGGTDDLRTSAPADPRPFAIYQARAAMTAAGSTSTLISDFPMSQSLLSSPSATFYQYLDGPNTSYTSGTSYTARGSKISSVCRPQRRALSVGVTALAAADLDFDGQTDLVYANSEENSNEGSATVMYAGQNGIGPASPQKITVSGTGLKFGSALSALDWRFINNNPNALFDEAYRRDLWVGSPGRNSGDGAVFGFGGGGYSSASLSSSVVGNANPLVDYSNSPNDLSAYRSRILGDINGDGFADILVPVKRMDSSGSEFYEAILYFGSPFGAVTNSFCKFQADKIYKQLPGSVPNGQGQKISTTDCLGTLSSSLGYLNNVQIRLPQYLLKPSGVRSSWVLSSFPAGDVNRDGKDDVVMFDDGRLLLFFGSDGGLVNAQPAAGPSNNRSPQLVSTTANLGRSPWSVEFNYTSYDPFSRPVKHGDLNGDGFEDLAFSNISMESPYMRGGWRSSENFPGQGVVNGCGANSIGNILTGSPNRVCGNPNSVVSDESDIPGHGGVFVLYGGPSGYQVPSGGADFNLTAGIVCSPFYEICENTTGGAPNPNVREVYGSLKYNQDNAIGNSWNNMYEIRGPNATGDAFNRAPCDPAAEAGYQCGGLATMIRNPVYYKHPSADNFSSLRYQFFGSSLSIADMNGDGIEDLVVGAHRHYVPNMHQSDFISKTLGSSYNNGVNAGQELTNSYYGINAESSGTQDPQYRGSVFIYYGTKFGVVAPKARSMIMDNGLGLYGTAPLISNDKHITFALSPPRWNAGMGLTPPLDGNGPQRMFGISMAAGDYNGDGLADLAVSSYNGQVYVYYGPICQTDNVPMLWGLATYANHNVAGDFSTVTESQRGRCTTPNFNTAGSQVTIPVAQATKLLNPQMISLSGASPSLRYGVVLMSAMPGKSGNLNGDPGVVPGDSISGTSDLIIGTHLDSDSNVPVASNKSTGKAIVLFGHCSSTPGCMMNSKPGLFVGPASYNGSLVSSTSGTQTFFQYSPVTLRPYEPDGSVPGFFQHYPTLGDLNGDKTGDLVMPTSQLNLGADRTTPVINGGGFKIIQ